MDWRSWAAEQAATIVHACQDVLTTPEPPSPVYDVFEICAASRGTAGPLLDLWLPPPVADAHFAQRVNSASTNFVRSSTVWLPHPVADAHFAHCVNSASTN